MQQPLQKSGTRGQDGQNLVQMHPPTWQTPSWQNRCRSSQFADAEQFRAHFVSDLPQPPAGPHSTQTFFNVYPASQPSEELALVPQSEIKNPAANTTIQRIDMGPPAASREATAARAVSYGALGGASDLGSLP
jgi:hypothetical protein